MWVFPLPFFIVIFHFSVFLGELKTWFLLYVNHTTQLAQKLLIYQFYSNYMQNNSLKTEI